MMPVRFSEIFFPKKGSIGVANLQEVKKRLLARKIELEEELLRLSREQVTDGQVQDPGDQVMASTLEDLNISLHNNERGAYAMILKALEMIDTGTYGICSDCGQAIAERRLQLYPNATRCLACQEALEDQQ